MKIKIHRGQDQIGGSIIEISSEKARLIFDIGIELDEKTPQVPEIDGLFCGNAVYDAVFISHYHADHIGLARHLLQGIPLYMGEKCYKINSFANEYVHKPFECEVNFIYPQKPVVIKDMKVTPFLCDHSAFDAYMYLIEADGKSVLYTGDYRANGRKSYPALLEKLPVVDCLITEGTTLSRDSVDNITEEELEAIADKAIAEHHPVFFLQSATNIDRIVTAYKIAKKRKLLFLQDLYMAGITSIIGGSIPNPVTFSDVKVFMTNNSDERHRQLERYGSKRIGREGIAKTNFAMCVRPSMMNYLEKLSEHISFENGILFYSMWSGYKEKSDVKAFLDFMESKGVKVHTLHTSGHADAKTIEALIEKVNPEYIVPVHTENAEWFGIYSDKKVIIGNNTLDIL